MELGESTNPKYTWVGYFIGNMWILRTKLIKGKM